jgi:hypothetical protein
VGTEPRWDQPQPQAMVTSPRSWDSDCLSAASLLEVILAQVLLCLRHFHAPVLRLIV